MLKVIMINMNQCVVAILLINTFYCSFGHPLVMDGTLGKSLQLLADSCQNTFISFQIKNQIDVCDIHVSPEQEIKESELECLIFYDINSRLCAELLEPKNLNETFELEINQVQNVDKICASASKNWKFTNITGYSKYYNTTQKVFKTPICHRACEPELLLSEDTNFFCKYYQWGSKILQQIATAAFSGNSGVGAANAKTAISAPNTSTSQNSVQAQSMNEQSQPDNVPEQEQAQLEVPNDPANIDKAHAQSPGSDALSNKLLKIDKESQMAPVATQVNTIKNNTEKSLLSKDLSTPNKPEKDLIPKTGKEDQGDNSLITNEADGPSYDSDDALDVAQLQRAPASDDNDPSLDMEPKKEKQENQNNNKESVVSLEVPGAQKEMYTNTMSEQFGEVDDHFFSFFLTATILVIFFYVLYHNKSKFRKVFLGLLVEGRQARRRSSRGHEYRRLDTLEQAMSTATTAPPSKIIY